MSNFQIPSPAFTVLALPCHGKLPTQKEVSLAVSFELQEKTAVCSDLCHSSSNPEPRAGLGSVDMMWCGRWRCFSSSPLACLDCLE